MSGLAGKAGTTARAAGKALRPVALKPGQVVDIERNDSDVECVARVHLPPRPRRVR